MYREHIPTMRFRTVYPCELPHKPVLVYNKLQHVCHVSSIRAN